MSEGILTLLKFCLLALVYLFLARVVWVVVSEMRGSATVGVAAPPAATAAPRARGRKVWRLTVVEPTSDQGEAHEIEGEATLGRAGGCTIPLASDTFVSQVHARVFERDGDLWAEDIGSTNGTFVNGVRIDAPVRLRKGDRLQVGQTVMEASR
ncbi:MAG TPA: FHA domain-containing protein [Acidimicrobiia bacterium]|nr:FHA domain-containing protein [Acidimicrobiia bacterium]